MSATSWSKAVITFLTPLEQQRVDAAGKGVYTTVHRENLDQVLTDLRAQPVSAVLVSVARYQQQSHAGQLARMVREFPGVPAVALLGAADPRHATQAVLQLGHQGVRTLVDVREPSGWRDLRQLVADEHPESIEAIARQRLHLDLHQAVPGCRRFFDMLFSVPRTLTTVRELTRMAGVTPTTFMSRFCRAGIPAPKKYLAFARLVRAARLFENPGYSITQVAFLLEYSSPQAFSRHVQNLLDMPAATFRRTRTGEQMLQEFRETLVLPYREALQTFDPFHSPPAWLSAKRSAPRDAIRAATSASGDASGSPADWPPPEGATPLRRADAHYV
jgi:AraC-like DNA-binding protein